MNQQKLWKQINNFSRYNISEDGVVWDTSKGCKTPTVWNGNFLCTNLVRDDGVKVLCKIHRLVAQEYLDNTTDAHNVIHLDDDRSNNHYTNLLWKPKKVKEFKEKVVQKYQWNGFEYSISELEHILDVPECKLKAKIKAGWKLHEIKAGVKDFSGNGYQTETHWFPTRDQMREHNKSETEKLKHQKEQERLKRKEDRENYKKYGVGVFVNHPIVGIENRVSTKAYRAWDAMLSRCYNPSKQSYPRYGGRGVSVDPEWHEFQTFAQWYESKYKEDDWHVDKDILVDGNMVYSKDTCVMVPSKINTFFSSLPKDGPTIRKNGNKFMCQMNIDGVKIYQSFDTEEAAVSFYKEEKIKAARLLAEEYEGRVDSRVISKLLNCIY